MKFTQSDLAHIENLMKALAKGNFTLQGTEILSMADAMTWLSAFRSMVKSQLEDPKPSMTFTEVKDV